MAKPESITWKIHLAAKHHGRAVAALILIFFALYAVAVLGNSLALTFISAVLLLASIAEFLLPIRYTLDANGAHSRQFLNHRLLPWGQVRRVYLSKNRIKLSPLAERGWAENYRGVLLRTNGSHERDEVMENLLCWLKDAGNHPEILED